MKDAPRWGVWKYVDRADGSKRSKVPFRAKDGGGASSTKPEHWTTHQEASVAFALDAKHYDGLGFVLGDGYAGVDLDDCLDPETKQLTDWAEEIVAQLDSYTEVSPSGTGLKIYCKGALPDGKRGKRAKVGDGAVEMYCQGRYFCFTGQHWEGTPETLSDATDELETVYRRWVDPPGLDTVVSAKAECKEKLKAMPNAVSGEQGHDTTFAAVCEIRRAALSEEESWELLDWYNEHKCFPSWSRPELEHKWKGACEAEPNPQPRTAESFEPFELDLVVDTAFRTQSFEQSYLVDRCVVQGEHLVIGGPQKALKTSLLVDLALSVATGKPFLGKFEVASPQAAIIVSGESGGATLQKLADRVSQSKQVEPTDNLYWGLRIPSLSVPAHLDALKRDIDRTGAKLAAVDPAYLATLAAGDADNASNVFKMGNVFRGFGQVGVETGCTMCLVHHLAGKPKVGVLPNLNHLAMAGFREWARQWLLVNHAKDRSRGKITLKLVTGGSAGHGGEYLVEVDEGRPDDPLVGRQWSVEVSDLQADAAEEEKPAGPSGAEARAEKLLAVLKEKGDWMFRRDARTAAKQSNDEIAESQATLLAAGQIEVEKAIRGGRETEKLRAVELF